DESELLPVAPRLWHTRTTTRTLLARTGSFAHPIAMPPVRLVPDLPHEALVTLDATLDHNVHQEIQQALDIAARQLATSSALLDQQYQLFESQLGTRGMDAGNRTWMTRVHVAQIVERLFRSQFRQQDPVGFHS